jgi:hypothetical protein
MPYRDIHEEELDRATGRMKVVRIHPTRQYLEWTPRGMALYAWQGGTWYGHGNTELPESEVPQKLRDDIRTNPVRISTSGPVVTEKCEFCGEEMNAADLKEHYVGHVRTTMAQAGKPERARA